MEIQFKQNYLCLEPLCKVLLISKLLYSYSKSTYIGCKHIKHNIKEIHLTVQML